MLRSLIRRDAWFSLSINQLFPWRSRVFRGRDKLRAYFLPTAHSFVL